MQIIARLKGAELKGRTYQPLFPYFANLKQQGAFQVVADPYVTADSGVGIVHQAPAFGEGAAPVFLFYLGKEMNFTCLAAGRLCLPRGGAGCRVAPRLTPACLSFLTPSFSSSLRPSLPCVP